MLLINLLLPSIPERTKKMTTPSEFREFGKAMIDYVADYLENIRDRPVLPDVKPGYLKELLPQEAPAEPEVKMKMSKTKWRHFPDKYA